MMDNFSQESRIRRIELSRDELRKVEDQLWFEYTKVCAESIDPNTIIVNRYTHDVLRMAITASKVPAIPHQHANNWFTILADISPDMFMVSRTHGDAVTLWRGLHIVTKAERGYNEVIEASFGILPVTSK